MLRFGFLKTWLLRISGNDRARQFGPGDAVAWPWRIVVSQRLALPIED
jgi:hypothetical protein